MNLSYSDLTDPGNSSIIKKVGSGVQGLVCGAYHNYKDWYHQNIDIGSAGGELLENFWDNICPAEPPYNPPSPGPGFGGGQCECVSYFVYYKWDYVDDPYPERETNIRLPGPIGGIRIVTLPNGIQDQQISVGKCDGTGGTYWLSARSDNAEPKLTGNYISKIVRADGQIDDCGNPPPPPPPPAPPDIINDNITIINNDGINIDIPVSINPKIFMPDLNINAKAFVFKPELNFSPQFNINQPPGGSNPAPPPSINFDFGPGGVGVTVGPGGSSSNKEFNNSVNFNNIVDIKNDLSDINIDIKKVADSLDCDPCEKLEEIKDILTYKPVYTSASIGNFQSVTRDNLFNLGYLEIELSKLPHSTKIIFGGDSPNAMYTGWLFWRHNEFNFEKIIIHSAKSVYHAPKWANGFAICCSHGARANVFYYTEVK